jgi:hypothetical protein
MASRKIACIEDAQYVAAATAQAASITNEAYVWAAIQLALMVASIRRSRTCKKSWPIGA